jgi:carboxyl-terminal processing protease
LLFRDTICVTHVNALSPAFSGGLKRGDRIVAIDGKPSTGKSISNEKVMARLKGAPNTQVKVTIIRKGKKLQKTLVRNTIPIATVPAYYMIDKQTGYIQIAQFSLPTAQEFHIAAQKLQAKGMTKLLLDLRGNGGGTMDAAIQIADEFLPDGYLILSSKGQHSEEKKHFASSAGILEKTKVVVLIDAQSASASEILAGALQDNDRAKIVGRRSYGKGLIQQDKRLKDGSNLRITVARYYTPSGRSIQRPYKKGYDAYRAEEQKAYTEEYFKPDSSIFVDSLKYKTRKGRTVYGGGGIMPDVFVALDTTESTTYFSKLIQGGHVNSFAFKYINANRTALKAQYPNITAFKNNFSCDKAFMDEFFAYVTQEEPKLLFDEKEYAISENLIKLRLKAVIAQDLWGTNEMFQIYNQTNEILQQAIQVLQSKQYSKYELDK